MVYLLDASVLISAHNQYYPIDRVPEYWDWLRHHAAGGSVKMPIEIFEEIKDGPKGEDLLFKWLGEDGCKDDLVLPDPASPGIVSRVIELGYAPDLRDDEVEQIGRDPFLVAHAISEPGRCVVTVETSAPGKQRAKRKIPNVCDGLGAKWCDPFKFTRDLGFSTDWKRRP